VLIRKRLSTASAGLPIRRGMLYFPLRPTAKRLLLAARPWAGSRCDATDNLLMLSQISIYKWYG